MMFMTGLSLGAGMVGRPICAQKIKRSRLESTRFNSSNFHYDFVLYLLTEADLLNGLLASVIALLFDGIFVSGIFAFTSLYKVSNQLKQIKPLYSADLIGGSIGSIAASLIFIPVWGYYRPC